MAVRADRIVRILAERGEDVEIVGGPGVGVHRVIIGIADTGIVAQYLGTDVYLSRPILSMYADPVTPIDVDSLFLYEGMGYSVGMKFLDRWAGLVDYACCLCGVSWIA